MRISKDKKADDRWQTDNANVSTQHIAHGSEHMWLKIDASYQARLALDRDSSERSTSNDRR